jgi:hypothetical protein
MIPPIWLMEINRINVKLGREPINKTEGDELTAMIEKGLISRASINEQTVCRSINFYFSSHYEYFDEHDKTNIVRN